jgi:hypothetical protein
MRARALAMLVSLVVPASVVAARRDCPTTTTKAFVACIGRTATALRSCARPLGEPCPNDPAVGRAATRLRRAVLADCNETQVRDAGHPPPFDPTVLASRLERTCLAEATALLARSTEALGGSESRRCVDVLAAAAARLAVRTIAATGACTLAGDACRATRTARRIAPVEAKARRAATRACRSVLSDAAVGGVLARGRVQMRCALAHALPASGTCAPSGLEALVDLWRLPTPRPPGTRLAQVSSYDRTGGNADLGIGPDTAPLLAFLGLPAVQLDFSYLYRDGDRYVVFDEVGPGVVWRIWMTGIDALFAGKLGGDVVFELDGEPVPRLQLDRAALFTGTTAPFLTPLAGDRAVSSGGFYSAVPIAFARRLRITTSTVPNWVQVTFAHLPPDQAVASFDPTADAGAVAALMARAGDPAATVAPTMQDEVDLAVAPGATQTAWTHTGGGTIVRLEVLAPAGGDVPTGLRLRATFDDAPTPQVDGPLDDFFGAALGVGARSVTFGRDGDRYYCYFPMPFRAGARLELRNDGAAPFAGWRLRVGTVDALPPGPISYFHATAGGAHIMPDGHDYVLVERAGAGHVVGVVMTAGCGAVGQCQLPNLPGLDGAHLEGDERITVDGSRWPQWHGTGLEDFFSGGFYFVAGAFTLPTHGNPAQVPASSSRRPGTNLRSVYRVFLGDAIAYESGIRLAIEHGPTNDVPADFSSLVFHYAWAAPALVETDRLTIGDAASEAAHALAVEDRADVSVTSAFRGDASDVPVTVTGITATVTRFTVTVPSANRGVCLRRLADLAAGRQSARVVVNGAFAGIWQTSEVNPFLRFAELDFEVPAALTEGTDTLAIEIDAAASPTAWTAFEYVALSR